jgi:hypothetical protein
VTLFEAKQRLKIYILDASKFMDKLGEVAGYSQCTITMTILV